MKILIQLNSNKEKIGIIATFIGGILWGINGTLGGYLFTRKDITANLLVPNRLLIAGFFMLSYLYFKNKEKVFSIWKVKTDAFNLLIFGIFGSLGIQYSYFITIQYSDPGIATILQYFGPTLILIYICLREKRKPKKFELFALILSSIGIFILATHGNITELYISSRALFWGLASAVILVIYTLQPIQLIKKYGTIPVLAWGMIIGGTSLMVFINPWKESVNIDSITILVFFAIVIFGTITSFTLYSYGVSIIGGVKGSMIACIEPVSASFFSTIFLKTPFSFLDLIGFILVLSTVFIVAYFGNDKDKK